MLNFYISVAMTIATMTTDALAITVVVPEHALPNFVKNSSMIEIELLVPEQTSVILVMYWLDMVSAKLKRER